MSLRNSIRKALLVLFMAPATLFAASPVITVSKAGADGETVSLDIRVSGAAAQLFANTLKADLERSGWFTVVNGRGSVNISGSAVGDSSLSTSVQAATAGGGFTWAESSATQSDARWQAHRFCDKLVKAVKNRNGMAATRIAFIGKQEGGDVYLCDSDGASLTRLTQDRKPALSPYFTPDSQYVFYTSFIKDFACVFRAPVAGGKREAFANFTGLNSGGAVSPDGKYIAIILSSPGNPELYVINLSTRVATRLTRTPRGAEASPCWSPDGNNIAYVSDAGGTPQIYVINANNKEPKRISYGGSQNVAPSWGADGRIAYCTNKNGGYQIAVYDPASGKSDVLTSGADHEDPSWAPDGRHIVCSQKEGAKRSSICILDTDTRELVRLPLRDGDWHCPEWSCPVAK